eukprot:scaffold179_cov368-Prasinococcus_capsulatus_cf.AAC.8
MRISSQGHGTLRISSGATVRTALACSRSSLAPMASVGAASRWRQPPLYSPHAKVTESRSSFGRDACACHQHCRASATTHHTIR